MFHVKQLEIGALNISSLFWKWRLGLELHIFFGADILFRDVVAHKYT